jgi:transcriptional regulator with GAF, ATPase, and Fis domain
MTVAERSSVAYQLHAAVTQTESLQQTLARIAALANQAVDGCRSTGLTRIGSDRPRTVATAGPFASRLDHAQFRDGEGPTVHALEHNEAVVVASIPQHAEQWTGFVGCAEELGVQSALAIPLALDGEPFAALNFYSPTEAAFAEATLEQAERAAVEAALAVHNAEELWQSREKIDQLHRALERRDRIGQAKGVLMARLGITSEQAFEVMRLASHRRSQKLHEVAERVNLTGELPD